jgi:predicted aspartyl protease
VTSVPLSLVGRNTKIAVPVTLDGVAMQVIVDTGSEPTVLDWKAVRGFEMTSAMGTLEGFGGMRGASLARLQKMEIGGMHGAVNAMVLDLQDKPPAPGTVGALGMDIMGAYDMDLDIPGRELGFYRVQGGCTQPATALGGPLYAVAEVQDNQNDVRPHLPVQIGGQSFTAVLDTGSPNVVLTTAAAQRLGLTEAVLRDDPMLTVHGVGPDAVRGHLHVMELSLGDLTARNVPVLVLPQRLGQGVDMILGLDLAKRIHFWLSASSHTIIMQYPPLPTAAPAGEAAK